MWFVLAVLSALVFGAAGLFMKASQAAGGSTRHLLFGLYAAGAAGFFIHSFFTPPETWFSWQLWLGGLIIGAGSAWGNLIWMRALDYGPASLTSLFTNMNIVLVILLATFWYGESVNGFQWTGIALLLGAIALVSLRPGEPLTIREKTWFALIVFSIALFTFRNGGLKVTSELELSNAAVLFIGYLLSLIWFGFAIQGTQGTQGTQGNQTMREQRSTARVGMRWGLLAGCCSYGGLQLYAMALEIGPANIIAPIFATNSLVIAVGAIIFFRERLTRLQIGAVLLLLIGLVLVRI
jgi:drug/metabolite transporter (DMT)-like permease